MQWPDRGRQPMIFFFLIFFRESPLRESLPLWRPSCSDRTSNIFCATGKFQGTEWGEGAPAAPMSIVSHPGPKSPPFARPEAPVQPGHRFFMFRPGKVFILSADRWNSPFPGPGKMPLYSSSGRQCFPTPAHTGCRKN